METVFYAHMNLPHLKTSSPTASVLFSLHLTSASLPLGKAVFLARDKHHLTDLCHLIRHDTPYLFQEYVKESHGRDVRVVLVGGRVIGSMLRCSTDGRMQSNCSLGRHSEDMDSELAQHILCALPLIFQLCGSYEI